MYTSAKQSTAFFLLFVFFFKCKRSIELAGKWLVVSDNQAVFTVNKIRRHTGHAIISLVFLSLLFLLFAAKRLEGSGVGVNDALVCNYACIWPYPGECIKRLIPSLHRNKHVCPWFCEEMHTLVSPRACSDQMLSSLFLWKRIILSNFFPSCCTILTWWCDNRRHSAE